MLTEEYEYENDLCEKGVLLTCPHCGSGALQMTSISVDENAQYFSTIDCEGCSDYQAAWSKSRAYAKRAARKLWNRRAFVSVGQG